MNSLLQLIHSTDLRIYSWLSGYAGNWVLDRLASHEEANNILKGGVMSAIYWHLWFGKGAERERRRRSIVIILAGAFLAVIVSRTISLLAPFRLRPLYDGGIPHPSYSIPITANLENWNAFPSDTATLFFALAFGIAYLSRRLAIPVLLYTAGWIALPRIYLGLHYPSDIVAGAAIGIATVWVLLRTQWLHSVIARRVLAFESASPQWFYPIAFLMSFELADLFNDVRNVGRVVVHLLRFRSYSAFMRPAFAVMGLALLAGYALFVLHHHIMQRRHHPATALKWPGKKT
jgi:undecaprenyl-diphosphatase